MGLDDIVGFVVNSVSEPVSFGWVIFGVLLLLVVLLSIKHIFDIAVDFWRIPFAIGIDAVDLLAYDKPYFDIVAAAAGFLLFWVFSKKDQRYSKFFGILVAAEALVGIWIFPDFAFITNLLPLATILMFFLTWH